MGIITTISYVYETYLHLAWCHGSTSHWMSGCMEVTHSRPAVEGSTGGIHKTPTTIGCALRHLTANGDEGFVDSHSVVIVTNLVVRSLPYHVIDFFITITNRLPPQSHLPVNSTTKTAHHSSIHGATGYCLYTYTYHIK